MSKVTKIETEHSIITIEAKETDLEFDKRVGMFDIIFTNYELWPLLQNKAQL